MFREALAANNPKALALAEQTIDEFNRFGLIHMKGVFTPAETAAMREMIDEIDRANLGVREDLPGGFFSLRAVTTDSVGLAGLACEGRIMGPVVQLFGPNIRLLGTQSIRREPLPADSPYLIARPHGWHRDVYGMGRDLGAFVPRCAAKYAIWLSDTTEQSDGGTRFLPGSHQAPPLKLGVGALDPPGIVAPPAHEGDVIVFENRTYHSGGINKSHRPFRVLLIQYGYRWLAPVINRPHAPHVAKLCSEFARQVLEPDECLVDGTYRPGTGTEPIREWALAHNLITHSV